MQLGARWSLGAPPHQSVPPVLHAAIAAAEAEHPDAGSWTLTWLEGRPRCALDDVALVTLTATGDPVSETEDDEADDWLS